MSIHKRLFKKIQQHETAIELIGYLKKTKQDFQTFDYELENAIASIEIRKNQLMTDISKLGDLANYAEKIGLKNI